MRFQDKAVIVTGGSSGIGRAICRLLASEGAVVTNFDRTEDVREGGQATVDEIQAAGGRAEYIFGDVTVWEDLDRVVSGVVASHGRLDAMINNAAISVGKPLLETSVAEWDQVMAVNAKGVFLGCKRAVQQMLEQDVVAEAGPHRQHFLSAWHDLLTTGYSLWHGQGGGGLYDPADRRRLWRPADHLQRRGAGQDCYRQTGPRQ